MRLHNAIGIAVALSLTTGAAFAECTPRPGSGFHHPVEPTFHVEPIAKPTEDIPWYWRLFWWWHGDRLVNEPAATTCK